MDNPLVYKEILQIKKKKIINTVKNKEYERFAEKEYKWPLNTFYLFYTF